MSILTQDVTMNEVNPFGELSNDCPTLDQISGVAHTVSNGTYAIMMGSNLHRHIAFSEYMALRMQMKQFRLVTYCGVLGSTMIDYPPTDRGGRFVTAYIKYLLTGEKKYRDEAYTYADDFVWRSKWRPISENFMAQVRAEIRAKQPEKEQVEVVPTMTPCEAREHNKALLAKGGIRHRGSRNSLVKLAMQRGKRARMR